ncbi:MAG: hypothetical protein PUF97_05580 [Bifidobacteriaceae bacterium]|nr:hypothetical protein [Bifidobacteriaceae bacterium]
MTDFDSDSSRQSHVGRITVVTIAAVALIVALVSAFAWPGWAVRHQNQKPDAAGISPSASVEPSALPTDASDLASALPKTVDVFARLDVTATQNWAAADPLEEYTVEYSDGNDADTVTLIMAQWSDADAASDQYSSLKGAVSGQRVVKGNVKVNGEKTGEYVIVALTDDSDVTGSTQTLALWRNDTVVFYATGSEAAVTDFYNNFPM